MKQIERLKQKAQTGQIQEQTQEQNQVEAVKQPLTVRIHDAIFERLTLATDSEKANAQKLILHLCTTLADKPELYACFQSNIASAVKIVTQILSLNLPISDTSLYYLVPYKDELKLHVSYQGLIELAYRSGLKLIYTQAVHEHDEFSITYSNTVSFVHKPNLKERGKLEGFYAMAKIGEEVNIEYMTCKQLDEHAKKFSKRSDMWSKHYESMSKKTVIRKVLKLCPKSPQLAQALSAEDNIEIEAQAD